MPKAVKGDASSAASARTGVLIACDPSIKAIILKIDQEHHDYIVEDLDDQTLVIKESQLPRLKVRLEESNTKADFQCQHYVLSSERSSFLIFQSAEPLD
ncbi:MAG: hypothetical protein L6R40_002029 [Gallowayella cf. fulva]|nr:MAG: hypothetical protein L6R40_002029 [Xanthomendoza cf. fulva]